MADFRKARVKLLVAETIEWQEEFNFQRMPRETADAGRQEKLLAHRWRDEKKASDDGILTGEDGEAMFRVPGMADFLKARVQLLVAETIEWQEAVTYTRLPRATADAGRHATLPAPRWRYEKKVYDDEILTGEDGEATFRVPSMADCRKARVQLLVAGTIAE